MMAPSCVVKIFLRNDRPAIIAAMSQSREARILVLYHSATGHTQSMAELVAEGARSIAETEVRLKNVEQATADDLLWCDGIAARCPTQMGTISWQMKKWWDEIAQPLWRKSKEKSAARFSPAAAAS
jgi:NAD(P)H dehydrogenase (quinone)